MAGGSDTKKPIKILVSGSREWNEWDQIEADFAKLYSKYQDRVILIHGDARGADRMAQHVAWKKDWAIDAHPADWKLHGRKAGVIRNIEMLDQEPDIIIAYRLDESKGTTHLINIAREAGYSPIVHDRWTPPKKKETKMEISENELQTLIQSAVQAALNQQPAAPAETLKNEDHATLKDIEGKPLRVQGQGVREVNGFAQKGCRNCGSGNVAWITSRTRTYPEGHAKAGQAVPYLAQGYAVGNRLIALAYQPHHLFCQGGGSTPTPVSTQEDEDSPSLPEGDDGRPTIDDGLEEDRAEPRDFDAFMHAEVNEIGTDVGMGFLTYGSLNDLEAGEKASLD